MHASMLAADPGLIYLNDVSLRVIAEVKALRARGTGAFFTMDAGPHVKVLTSTANAEAVAQALGQVPGVERVLISSPGPDAALEAG